MNHKIDWDRLVTMVEAPATVEQLTGVRPNRSTCFRWAQRGCKGVKLRTQFVGGIRRTSARWLQEFFDRTTEAVDSVRGTGSVSPGTFRRSARKRHEEAERRLSAAGV